MFFLFVPAHAKVVSAQLWHGLYRAPYFLLGQNLALFQPTPGLTDRLNDPPKVRRREIPAIPELVV